MRMKRFFLFVSFLFLLTTLVMAQNTGLTSITKDVSEGVFTNELDAALSVEGLLSSGPGFGSLNHDYLFSGLTNLDFNTFSADSTFTVGSPLWAGFYKAGEKPWSIFGAFGATGAAGNSSGGTVYTQGAPGWVTTGTDTINYQWNDNSSTMDYTANRIFDALNISGQYLLTLGGFNTGVFVNVNLSNTDPQGSNYKQTDVYYYNSTGAGVVPTPLVDYNYARTQTARNNTSIFRLSVPFYIQDTDSSQLFNVQTYFSITDKSVSDTESYSGTPQSVIGLTTTTVAADTTARALTGQLVVDYTLKKKGLWGGNPKDQLWFTGTADFSLDGGTYGTSGITQDISAAGGGAAIVNGARADTQVTNAGTPGMTARAAVGVGHSFYYDLGSGVEFGLKPAAGLDYTLTLPVMVKSNTTTVSTDGNANGVFTDAADTIQTTTVTYTNTSIDTLTGATAAAVVTNTITCSVDLPMAVTFTPPKWPITFTLGSKPSLGMNMTFTSTKTSTTSTAVSIVDGTGTAIGGTTTTNAVTADETSKMSTSYTMTATHNIGFSMPISDAVRIDANLDMSGPLASFDFKALTAQVIIALP